MLPKTLQRAVRPAKSLLRQHAQSLRGFRPADRLFFIADLVAALANLHRQVLIFRQCALAKAAALFNQLPSPRPNCAGHNGDAVQARERAPIHILRSNVLQRLPARDDVDAVTDLRIAGDCAHGRIDEAARQRTNRLRGELRVGIKRDDDFAFGVTQSNIQRGCFAGIRNRQQTH